MIGVAKLTSGVLALAIVGISQAMDFPIQAFDAHYAVYRNGDQVGTGQLQLKPLDNKNWSYQRRLQPNGLLRLFGITITEASNFYWDETIHVTHYQYQRTGKEKQIRLDFDWQAMQVSGHTNQQIWHIKIPPGAQDRLSINLALQAQLASDIPLSSITIADDEQLKQYDFNKLADQWTTTALGRFKTLQIIGTQADEPQKQTALWIAPDLDYAIVRLEHTDTEKDEQLLMLLQSLTHWPDKTKLPDATK